MNFINTLGLTLLHFLWQGAVIALALAAVNALLRRAPAQARYLAGCIALALMLVCVAATFFSLGASPSAVTGGREFSAPAVPQAVSGKAPEATASQTPSFALLLPWFVYFWIAGVCVLTLRSLGGWLTLQRFLRRDAKPAEALWQRRAAHLARRLRISRAVRLCESAVSEIPAVIGWLRPVVLLPASALSGLAPEQLESLLAHELAHIRRHDYLVNLAQTAVETLLFYHPAVWWIGARIRAERENCCDDLAVRVCGDALIYARALAGLEQLRRGAPRLAMAASHGPLLQRIQRLLSQRQPARAGGGAWLPGSMLTLLLFAAWMLPSPRLALSRTTQQKAPVNDAIIATRAVASTRIPGPYISTPRLIAGASGKETAPPQASGGKESSGLLDEMNQAGYRDLTADQLIALKIHGVTGEYVRQIQALSYKPAPDQLVAMKIHNVTAEYIGELRSRGWNPTIDQLITFRIHGVDVQELEKMAALGYKLDPGQAVAMRIHGLTAAEAGKIKALGLGEPSFDQLLSMKIHDAGADFSSAMKQTGIRGLDIDKLIALRIHGATPAEVKEMQDLGFKDLDADQEIRALIHGVTPGFVRDARKRGFKDQTLDQLIRLKQTGQFD